MPQTLKPDGEGDRVASLMVKNFIQSGHPTFKATSALKRGVLKSKGGGRKSLHFCANADTVETVFRTIVSANQLSIYGAVADLCVEFGTHVGLEKTRIREDQSQSMVAPTDLYDLYKPLANDLERGNPVHDYQQRVQNLSNEAQLIKLSADAGFVKTVAPGLFFVTRNAEEFSVGGHIGCREYTLPRNDSSSEPKGGIRAGTKIGPVLEVTTNRN